MIKKCVYCLQDFESDRPNSLSCKSCYDEAIPIGRKNKRLAVSLMGGKCSVCGYNKSNEALEFHHLDPTIKDFGVTKTDRVLNVLREARKCALVCSNCHREIHAGLTTVIEPNYEKLDEHLGVLEKELKKVDDYSSVVVHHKARKVIRPSKTELENILVEYGGNFSKLSLYYGVSDNAVRKWCIAYNMPKKSAYYKR